MVFLDNEACTEIEDELVLCKLGSIACGEVVSVVAALRNDTGSIGSGSGDVGLVLGCACGK